MKRCAFFCFCALWLVLASVPSLAQMDLYDNGPTDGFDLGWTLNFGFAVSDQFTLTSQQLVNGFTFAAWLFPGDTLQSAEVSITSSEFGGTTFYDNTVNFTTGSCFSNGGFNVCNETASLQTFLPLDAGSYWLNLSNAAVPSGDPVYWDMNSGPSLASENSEGTIPSESFTILGGSGPGTGPGTGADTTPEPASIMLFGSGALGVAGMLRRKLL